MEYNFILPQPQLAPFIKYYWTLQSDGKSVITEKVHATGEPQIIFHFGKSYRELDPNGNTRIQPQNLVCGQMTNFKDISSTGRTNLIGIVFQPFGLKPFLNIPISELTNNTVNFSDVQHHFRDLELQLPEKSSTKERIVLIEQQLQQYIHLSDFDHFRSIRYSISAIEQSIINLSIKNLNRKIGVSDRQQERLFQEYIGLSPKGFAKITRFMRAVHRLKILPTLTQVAYQSGFYDQAHFIHEFKSLTGMTPSAYRRILCTY